MNQIKFSDLVPTGSELIKMDVKEQNAWIKFVLSGSYATYDALKLAKYFGFHKREKGLKGIRKWQKEQNDSLMKFGK